jgi:hypothetical protein
MSLRLTMLLALMLGVLGCATGVGHDVVAPGVVGPDGQLASSPDPSLTQGRWGCWGIYDLEIACDGSYVNVVPDRSATVRWGYHLNAVKFLEEHPCTTCFRTGNLRVLPNGDVSIDVTLEHPWPDTEENRYCTGFDVRGIVMFKASQLIPDNDLRIRAGLAPWHPDDPGYWKWRYSSSEKGDPELMNPDGWTQIFAPDAKQNEFDLDEGFPVEYYRGRYATGEDLASINAYRHFWTNETRHMFEVGKSATRTYIIRPPAVGPVIEASYAVYAHWAPPSVVPVVDPATDFPPQANSSLPYEFRIYQTRVFDPDPPGTNGIFTRWYVKTWSIGREHWLATNTDLMYLQPLGGGLFPVPGGEPDEYWATMTEDDDGDWPCQAYYDLNEMEPDTFPGSWPFVARLEILDPNVHLYYLSADYYISHMEFEENDGEW